MPETLPTRFSIEGEITEISLPGYTPAVQDEIRFDFVDHVGDLATFTVVLLVDERTYICELNGFQGWRVNASVLNGLENWEIYLANDKAGFSLAQQQDEVLDRKASEAAEAAEADAIAQIMDQQPASDDDFLMVHDFADAQAKGVSEATEDMLVFLGDLTRRQIIGEGNDTWLGYRKELEDISREYASVEFSDIRSKTATLRGYVTKHSRLIAKIEQWLGTYGVKVERQDPPAVEAAQTEGQSVPAD